MVTPIPRTFGGTLFVDVNTVAPPPVAPTTNSTLFVRDGKTSLLKTRKS